MTVSNAASLALSELLQTESNIVGFSEDLHEGETLLVYVENAALTDQLPTTVAGHAVRYVEVGVQHKITTPAVVDVNPRTRVRPLIAGVSLSPEKENSAGTLGYFVTKNGDKGILTCAHVLPTVGQRVIQQGGLDGGTDPDVIAKVVTSVDDGRNVDCAFAALDKAVEITVEINAVGAVSGVRAAKTTELVKKSGRTTKLTTGGQIIDVNATIMIGPDVYKGQILVTSTGQFASGGDSGSLLITEKDTAAVGLVMASNKTGTATYANHIAKVEEALGVNLL